MHAARLSHSPRLQRVHALLSDGAEHSTFDIIAGARVAAVSAIVSELRDNGAVVECRQTKSRGGERLFLYRLIAPVPEIFR